MRLWIKDPLACLADGAERGIIVENGRIAELVGRGSEPGAPADAVFDAGEHVVLPGLINTHHHMYQTLTRAHPQAINKELFPWLQTLYPVWAGLTPEGIRLGTRLALTELLMSGCTTAADHHYLIPAGCEDAIDIQVEQARALGMRMTLRAGRWTCRRRTADCPRRGGAGSRHDPGRQRAGHRPLS
jgi:8-oxoguanine deaminase